MTRSILMTCAVVGVVAWCVAPAWARQQKPPTQQQVTPPAQKPVVAAPPAQGQAPKPGTAQVTPPVATQVTPPVTTQAPKPATAQAQVTAKPSSRLTAMVFVTDPSGKPWPDVKVIAIGPITREVMTDRDGVARLTALRAGTYRLRFESTAVVTFERELALKAGPVPEVEVTLSPAPPPPPPPPSPRQDTPAAPVRPMPSAVQFAPAAASLPDWIERNYIGRTDPSTEGLVGETGGAKANLLQIRDPLRDRARPDADQFFYVIAGDGTAKVGDRQDNITNGWLVVVPRGTACSFERRGRNPLFLLAIVVPAQ